MIRHRNRIVLALICCPALFVVSAARGQITSAVQQQSPLTVEGQRAVAASIAAQASKLDSDTPKDAREKLVNDCEGHGGVVPSHEFQAEYAGDLVKSLTPLLASAKPLHVRLNAAIVIGRVAEKLLPAGVDDQFVPIVKTLLQDKQPALALWGIKAAKYVVPTLLQSGANSNTLQDQVIKCVKSFPEHGGIVAEAYAVLTLEPVSGSTALGQLAGGVVPHLMQLVDYRTSLYAGGQTPVNPLAEKAMASFVPVNASPAWLTNLALRNSILKSVAALTCAQLQAISNGNTDQDLVDAAKSDGAALSTMGKQIPVDGAPLIAAGTAINSITIASQSNGLTERCKDLNQALTGLGVTAAVGQKAVGSGQ